MANPIVRSEVFLDSVMEADRTEQAALGLLPSAYPSRRFGIGRYLKKNQVKPTTTRNEAAE
jgi:hypothetical protein